MNLQDLRNELSNQKWTNQPFLFKCKIDLVGKLVETIMPFKDVEACKTTQNLEISIMMQAL